MKGFCPKSQKREMSVRRWNDVLYLGKRLLYVYEK